MAVVIPDDLCAPGTHVLVIGVSAYRHFADGGAPTELGKSSGMKQLRSAARSASDVAQWLQNRSYLSPLPPLRSLRVFLSPGENEQIADEYRALDHLAATRANVEPALAAFETACYSHRDNHAVIYVAGHGVQLSTTGAVLLLEDFGTAASPRRMHGSLDLIGLHQAFNNEDAPKHQFWFVDACRQPPELARYFDGLLSGALSLDAMRAGSADSSLLLLSAITGTTAYGKRGGRSFFADGLLHAIDQGAAAIGPDADGVDRWHVPLSELLTAVPDRVSELAQAAEVEQWVEPAGMPRPAVFHVYPEAPRATLTISIDPAEAAAVSQLTLRDEQLTEVAHSTEWPALATIDAGLYAVEVVTASPFRAFRKLIRVDPPTTRLAARVQP